MRTALFFVLMSLLIPYSEAQRKSVPAPAAAQSSVPLNLPTSSRSYKPKVSLQTGLGIAESYVASEHINVSDGWLSEARFILYGGRAMADKDKEPNWLFVWATDRGYVQIMVSMDGKAMVLPEL
jgi:hypothetical protein